ncbi:MAG: universal stress protein, partial [Thermodesulfobacteriota bacterium]
ITVDELNKIDFSVEASYGLSEGISIADYANSNKFDLIVMHTHGRKGIKKHILGSVTEQVIQQARCSVLAIRT